jgi:3'-phosphoadenosine 5'-phosphosulfate sulfotransferase (PAPS reductase)/FAD synthetase
MRERHLLALSGGKDSAALAVYMREKYPDLPLEYIFIDSGCELPETYAYLDRIEAVLDIKVEKIGIQEKRNRKDFDWWLKRKNYYLPSPRNRWCTEVLKLEPYAQWIKRNCEGEIVHSYVGLRADEKRDRSGFTGASLDIAQHHPFVDAGFMYEDVVRVLNDSGLGFPDYFKWRSRSGCYFCFFQTKAEWIGLYKNHPDLFLKASSMEKTTDTGKAFTWNEGFSLIELLHEIDSVETVTTNDNKQKEKYDKLCNILSECVFKKSCERKTFLKGRIK